LQLTDVESSRTGGGKHGNSQLAILSATGSDAADLNDGAFTREKFRMRIIGTEHQQQIEMHDRVADGLGADHADAAHPMMS
jgi:hypothetical protein